MNSQPNIKEDPKEWRKAGLMSAGGLAVGMSVLRWRHVLPVKAWECILAALALVALAALAKPRLFHGLHRCTTKLSFVLGKVIGRILLAAFFFLVIVPLALVWRMMGKDPLKLRRPANAQTYWTKARTESSLENLF